jgi:hypothetical protein
VAELPKPFYVAPPASDIFSKVKSLLRRCTNPACPRREAKRIWTLSSPKGIQFLERWYCGTECLSAPLQEECGRLLGAAQTFERPKHRLPIGLFLVSKGVITAEELDEALRLQRENAPRRLGYWLRQIGAVSPDQLAAALAVQWACPTFPLEGRSEYLQCAQLMPLVLLESEQMLPVHYSSETNVLYIALADRVDYSTMFAIEKILDCRTAPCAVLEDPLLNAL